MGDDTTRLYPWNQIRCVHEGVCREIGLRCSGSEEGEFDNEGFRSLKNIEELKKWK